jgi:hypothetical protein
MILELPAAAKWLAPVAKAAAPLILKALNSQLNPTEIEKALQAGLIAAHTQEDKQPQGQHIFFKLCKAARVGGQSCQLRRNSTCIGNEITRMQ